jgi:hypothetical protein
VNWAKHHLAVSRRKEEEPSSSSSWNINLPGAPPVDFYKVGETVSQGLGRRIPAERRSFLTTRVSSRRTSSCG